jgi:NADPH-dependent ferric siderophore reductase
VTDQLITFIFPTGDRTVPPIDRDFSWDRWFAMDEAERPHTRNDTVRHWRPSTSQPAIAG